MQKELQTSRTAVLPLARGCKVARAAKILLVREQICKPMPCANTKFWLRDHIGNFFSLKTTRKVSRTSVRLLLSKNESWRGVVLDFSVQSGPFENYFPSHNQNRRSSYFKLIWRSTLVAL